MLYYVFYIYYIKYILCIIYIHTHTHPHIYQLLFSKHLHSNAEASLKNTSDGRFLEQNAPQKYQINLAGCMTRGIRKRVYFFENLKGRLFGLKLITPIEVGHRCKDLCDTQKMYHIEVEFTLKSQMHSETKVEGRKLRELLRMATCNSLGTCSEILGRGKGVYKKRFCSMKGCRKKPESQPTRLWDLEPEGTAGPRFPAGAEQARGYQTQRLEEWLPPGARRRGEMDVTWDCAWKCSQRR